MKNYRGFSQKGLLLLFSLLLLSACGGQSYASRAPKRTLSSLAGTSSSGSTGTSGTSGTTTNTTTTTTSGVSPQKILIDGTGTTEITVSVKARSRLKVRFFPRLPDPAARYAGLSVTLTVGSTSKQTPMLYNGFYQSNLNLGQQSDIYDLSSAFTKSCASDDSGCREVVEIKVSKPFYDFYCVNYGAYCGYSTEVASGHPWHGTLEVETDDTDALQ